MPGSLFLIWNLLPRRFAITRSKHRFDLCANNQDCKCAKKVHVLPKSPDEKVARLHLAKIGQDRRPVQAGSLWVLS
jgi:hypothetical protein